MWDASLGSTMLAVVRPRYLCRDPGMAARIPIAIASSLILKACRSHFVQRLHCPMTASISPRQ